MTRQDAESSLAEMARALGMKRRAQLLLVEDMALTYARALERHDGWGSYEAFAVQRWLAGDEVLLARARERARQGPEAVSALASEELARLLTEGGLSPDGPLGELLAAPLRRVDWAEVAGALLGEA